MTETLFYKYHEQIYEMVYGKSFNLKITLNNIISQGLRHECYNHIQYFKLDVLKAIEGIISMKVTAAKVTDSLSIEFQLIDEPNLIENKIKLLHFLESNQ